jgi:predicted outer membrane repeat protein
MSGVITSNAFAFKDSLGQSHFFVKGADNGLWDNVDGVWQGLGGIITSDPCAVEDRQGVTHIFVIGTDGALLDRVLGAGWTNLGGYVTSNPSAALSPDGHIKIAVKSGDDSLLVKDLTTGEWSSLGGKITTNPQLIFDAQGKMHVLARGGDAALWDNVDGTWQCRGGFVTSDARPIINPFNPGFIYTSVRGGDSGLWCNALDTASGTSTWTGLGGFMVGTPAPCVDTDGVLHNFVRGTDDGLWDNANGIWYNLGGYTVSHPSAFRDKDGKLRVAVVGGDYGLWVNTVGIGMTPTTLVGSFTCDYNKIQPAIDAISSGGIVKVLSGTYPEDVNINKELTLIGTGNPTASSFTLNAILGKDSGGITAQLITVNAGFKILQGIDLANIGATVNVNGAAGYVYSDDLTQSFYAKGITLTGINNPVTKSISLHQLVAGKIFGITANSVNVNPNAKILQGIDMANTGASVNVNGAAGYTYSDDLTQSFYAKGITLTGINNPVTKSISLDQLVAGKIFGITANTVNVNPNAKILQGIDMANTGASVNVNGAAGYTYSDDLTQSFYAKGITLKGINSPVTKSISLDQHVAGKIFGITANTVNVNPNAKILQGIGLANTGSSIIVNGAAGYTYSDDLTQSFYVKGITLTGVNNPVTESISLDQQVAGKIFGITANTVNVLNPNAKIQDGVILVYSGGTINVAAGSYLENVDINKDLILVGTDNPVATSFTLNTVLETCPYGIFASKVTVNPPSKILDGISISSNDVYINGDAGYTYGDDLTQSFYAKGISLTGINNPVINSFSLDRDIDGRIFGITANTVNVNPNAKILQGIGLANTDASVNVNGATGYTYSDDLTQSFYAKGISLTGINNPITKSISLDQLVAGRIFGIAANTVNVNPNAKILQGIGLANAGASVKVNGAAGYTYSDDLTQSFYAKGITLNGINNPVTKSILLNQLVAGKISGITADTVNVLNPNAMIQDGIILASSGGTVNVAAGTYKENVMIDKSLAVNGAGAGSSIVDGNRAGSAFTLGKNDANVDVSLSGMTLTGGTGTPDTGGIFGGGIINYGSLLVTDCTISGNTAGYGGGIQNSGTATIADTTISGNAANTDGGGINSRGTLTMNSGSITKNTAKEGGGGIGNSGTLTMNSGSIAGNTAIWGSGISNSGTLTMNSGSITENTATEGGGIRNSGTLNVNSGSIAGNAANVSGGGIGNSGTLNLGGGSITGNKAVCGGGIGNSGTLNMNSGSITENTANDGSGIFNDNHGTVNMDGGSIDRNKANMSGGGICSSGGTVNMDGGSITKNMANVSGGGIYSNIYGTMNLDGGEIIENSATYHGGGIYSQGTVHLHGGNIAGNVASDGGGIYSSGTITMNSGSINGNIANNGAGGGVYSSSCAHIAFDGVQLAIKSNKAGLPSPSELCWYQGWGVYLEDGTPAVTGDFDPATQVTGNIHI